MKKALDLFCGAGGASRGLAEAGYEVTGVDIAPQSRYPYTFIQADALEVALAGFDLIWASPPCQRYSLYSRNTGTAENHPDLVGPVRERLQALCGEAPWEGPAFIIENVVGAPLRIDYLLCGTMFGLQLLRHRIFEVSWAPGLQPVCAHRGDEIPVYGNGTPEWHRRRLGRNVTIAEKREAMGIDWMNRRELSQAIPPAFARFLGKEAARGV